MVNTKLFVTFALAGAVAATSYCEEQDNACRTAPGANMAVCSAQLAQCEATQPPPTRTPILGPAAFVPPKYVTDICQQRDNECRTAPGANMAYCASENAMCMSAAKRECGQDYNDCTSSPNADVSLCAEQKKECEILSRSLYAQPSPAFTPSASATPSGACPAGPSGTPGPVDCEKRDQECRSAPGANMAVCAAKKEDCEKWNAWAPPMPSGTPGPVDCEKRDQECRTAPGANMAACAAKKANCERWNAWAPPMPAGCATPTMAPPVATTPPVFTGAASSLTAGVSTSIMALLAVALAWL